MILNNLFWLAKSQNWVFKTFTLGRNVYSGINCESLEKIIPDCVLISNYNVWTDR